MANMSYCIFQNTNEDFGDCLENLNNISNASFEEQKASRELYKKALEYIKRYEENSLLDKLEKIYELCSYCNQEVELENKLEPQKCPNCKKIIMPCSICDYRLAETSNHEECKQCERDCISRELDNK